MAVARLVDTHSDEYILGQNIRDHRIACGLSQTQLADRMDMDRSAISRYENGTKGEMGFKTLKRFAQELGVTTDELIGGKGIQEKNRLPENEEWGDTLSRLDEENKEMIRKMAEALYMKQTLSA